MTGEARTAGFLHDQPIPAGAQPRSTHRPRRTHRPGLTAASTGTPSKPEEPRLDHLFALLELIDIMTEELDQQTMINNPVYTADLTTSRVRGPAGSPPSTRRTVVSSVKEKSLP